MTIEEILDEMENLLLESSRIPFTNKRLVGEDELGRLLDELREVLPGELMQANRIISERLQILEQAQKDAQTIVDQAKNYIHKLTDENTITRQAQEQANEILQQAQKASKDLENDSVKYADEVFSYLENHLEKTVEAIRQSHSKLLNSQRES